MWLVHKLTSKTVWPALAGGLLLSAAWAVWCVFLLPKGLELSHVGLYCSDAARLAQGDLPFVDGIINAVTLAPLWLSFAFRSFSGITLLELRIIWAIAMLMCALVVAAIMLRYFRPPVAFTAAAASLFFVTGNSYQHHLYRVLSYNSLPYLPALLAAWLWLAAYRRRGRMQFVLAAGAGLAALLAAASRFTLLLMILLPFLTILYDRLCRVETPGLRKAAIAYLASYAAGIACFFLVLAATGLSGDFSVAWELNTSGGRYSLGLLASNSTADILNILLPALPVVLVVLALRYSRNLTTLPYRTARILRLSYRKAVLLASICLVALVTMTTLIMAAPHTSSVFVYTSSKAMTIFNDPIIMRSVAWYIFLAAIGAILVDIMLNLFSRAGNGSTSTKLLHERCQLGVIAVFMGLTMVLGTYGPMNHAAFKGGAWLTVALGVSLCWDWATALGKRMTNAFLTWIPKTLGVTLMVSVVFFGVYQDYHPAVWQLNTSPRTQGLQGIMTTAERADFVDAVVAAVERHTEPGDRIFFYYFGQMFYWLSDRLPATYHINPAVVTNEVRQAMLEDMIRRDRYPKIVVYSEPPAPRYAIDCPIDRFVRENYQAVEEIVESGEVPVGVIERTFRFVIMVPGTAGGGPVDMDAAITVPFPTSQQPDSPDVPQR